LTILVIDDMCLSDRNAARAFGKEELYFQAVHQQHRPIDQKATGNAGEIIKVLLENSYKLFHLYDLIISEITYNCMI
jgi:hypothetical protein